MTEHVVGNLERLNDRSTLGNNAQKFFVGDDNERIDVLTKVFNALFGIFHTFFAFEIERFGNDSDGKDTHFTRDACHDGSSAGARSATHTCGDENEIVVLQNFFDLVDAFLCSLFADGRIGTCAETFRKFRAELDFQLRLTANKGLIIGIHSDEFRAFDTCVNHSVNSIVSAAADTYNTNTSNIYR